MDKKIIAIVGVIAIVVIAAAAYVVLSDDDDDSSSSYDDGAISVETYNSNYETITQTYEKAPERIIAGNDTCLEILLYFGLGDKIVGVYYDEDEPWYDNEYVYSEYQKVKERLGDEHMLKGMMSQAVATELEPDLVMGYASSFGEGKWALGSVEYWNKLNCNVWALNTQASDNLNNFEGMTKDFNNIGDVFDIRDKTDAYLSDMKDAMDKANASGKECAALDRTTTETTGTYWFYGDKTFIGSLITGCGATNTFPDGGKLDKSKFIDATNMDAIIVMVYGTEIDPIVQALYNDSDLQNVPAIKNQKAMGIGLSETYGGVRALTVLNNLVELLNSTA